jgi:hypothetical protein
MFSYANAEYVKRMTWSSRLKAFLVLPLLMACALDFFKHSRQVAGFCAILFFALSLFDRKPAPESPQPASPEGSAPTPIPDARQLPLSWKVFRPIAALCCASLLIWPLWPLAGAAVLIWLLSYFAWEYYASSRFSQSQFTILSLQ